MSGSEEDRELLVLKLKAQIAEAEAKKAEFEFKKSSDSTEEVGKEKDLEVGQKYLQIKEHEEDLDDAAVEACKEIPRVGRGANGKPQWLHYETHRVVEHYRVKNLDENRYTFCAVYSLRAYISLLFGGVKVFGEVLKNYTALVARVLVLAREGIAQSQDEAQRSADKEIVDKVEKVIADLASGFGEISGTVTGIKRLVWELGSFVRLKGDKKDELATESIEKILQRFTLTQDLDGESLADRKKLLDRADLEARKLAAQAIAAAKKAGK